MSEEDLQLGKDGKCKFHGIFEPHQRISIQEKQPPTNAAPLVRLAPQYKKIHGESLRGKYAIDINILTTHDSSC